MRPKSSGASFPVHGFAHPARNVEVFALDPSMKVADFGAGSGAYALLLAKAVGKSGVVYAVDIQKDLLRRIQNEGKRHGHHIEILWGDLETDHGSKLADGILDFVLVSNLLFQVSEPAHVIHEAKRVLRPGGRLAIIDWTDSFGGLGPIPADIIGKERAYAYAHDEGLTFMKEFPAGAHHFGLLFRKHSTKGRGSV